MSIVPELLIRISAKDRNFLGYMAIDSFVDDVAMGGIRVKVEEHIQEEEYSKEAAFLAREMSLKFGFHSIPVGGAKMVVRMTPGLKQDERDQYFLTLGAALAPLLKKGVIRTGQDMGMTDRDLYFVGLGTGERKGKIPENHSCGSAAGRCTALGMAFTMDEVLKYIGLRNDVLTCCIDGFGNVGANLAVILRKKGIRIAGVSTTNGAIFNPAGLDVDRLIQLKAKFEDRFIQHYDGIKPIKKGLTSKKADMFFPCASFDSITFNTVDSVQAKIIIAGANYALDEKTAKALHAKDIIYIPGFVANAGAILRRHFAKNTGILQDNVMKELENHFSGNVKKLLESAQRNNCSVLCEAEQIAHRNIALFKRRKDGMKRKIIKNMAIKAKILLGY